MPVEVVDEGLLIVDGGATSVRVGSPVGCIVIVLLVVLSPVEMYTILHYVLYIHMGHPLCKGVSVCVRASVRGCVCYSYCM